MALDKGAYNSYLKDGGEGAPSVEALVNGHAGPAVPNSVGAGRGLHGVCTRQGSRTWGSPQDATGLCQRHQACWGWLGALDGGARTAGPPEASRADSEASCPASAGTPC